MLAAQGEMLNVKVHRPVGRANAEILIPGSAGCQSARFGSLPKSFYGTRLVPAIVTRKVSSASCRRLQAGSLRSPDSRPVRCGSCVSLWERLLV
jgi:hypothetical protein